MNIRDISISWKSMRDWKVLHGFATAGEIKETNLSHANDDTQIPIDKWIDMLSRYWDVWWLRGIAVCVQWLYKWRFGPWSLKKRMGCPVWDHEWDAAINSSRVHYLYRWAQASWFMFLHVHFRKLYIAPTFNYQSSRIHICITVFRS